MRFCFVVSELPAIPGFDQSMLHAQRTICQAQIECTVED
jgi:hypothetical protein